MHVLYLQVAIAAGNYPIDLFHLLMCYSSVKNHKLSHFTAMAWAANAKHTLAVKPSVQTRIHLTARTVIARLYMEKFQ